MHPDVRRIASRIFLIVAVLLGQLTGGSACCCWIRHCLGPVSSASSDWEANNGQVEAFACPKCLARYKKTQGTRDQLHGAPCQCGDHETVAICQEPDLESRVRVDMTIPAVQPVSHRSSWSCVCRKVGIDVHSGTERLSWQSRACIWRI